MLGLSICTGIGGIDLGLAAAVPGYRTVCYIERDAYCASTLVRHMQTGALHDAPIWSDVTTFDARPWRGAVDLIHGGIPCQPFSCAGKRKADRDPRHLWPCIADIIRQAEPTFTFFENVPGIVSAVLSDVCADLQGMGYDISAGIFSAAENGAPHERKRLFIFAAQADRARLRQQRVADAHDAQRRPDGAQRREMGHPNNRLSGRWKQSNGKYECSGATVANPDGNRRRQGQPQSAVQQRGHSTHGGRAAQRGQLSQPGVGRMAHGFSDWLDRCEGGIARTLESSPVDRIDRLRSLGNAVVPRVAAQAWRDLHGSMMRAYAHGQGLRTVR